MNKLASPLLLTGVGLALYSILEMRLSKPSDLSNLMLLSVSSVLTLLLACMLLLAGVVLLAVNGASKRRGL